MIFAMGVQAFEVLDPTRPVDLTMAANRLTHAGRLNLPVLQSILIAPKRRVAVIDGIPVVEGSVVHGYTVERISATGVIAKGEQGKIELKLLSDVKTW
jgi:hypothetical protein